MPPTDPTAALRAALRTTSLWAHGLGCQDNELSFDECFHGQCITNREALNYCTTHNVQWPMDGLFRCPTAVSQADDPDAAWLAAGDQAEKDAVAAEYRSQTDDPSGPDVEAAWEALKAGLIAHCPDEFPKAILAVNANRPIIEAAIRAER